MGPSQGPPESKLLMILNFLLTCRLNSALWVGNGSWTLLCVCHCEGRVTPVLESVTGQYVPPWGVESWFPLSPSWLKVRFPFIWSSPCPQDAHLHKHLCPLF